MRVWTKNLYNHNEYASLDMIDARFGVIKTKNTTEYNDKNTRIDYIVDMQTMYVIAAVPCTIVKRTIKDFLTYDWVVSNEVFDVEIPTPYPTKNKQHITITGCVYRCNGFEIRSWKKYESLGYE